MNENRRGFLRTLSRGLAGGLALTSLNHLPAHSQKERPNILFVISDDQSWLHVGAYGDEGIHTPAFDRLAREGVLFNYAFTAAPSCTPSRSAVLTGQHAWRLEEGSLLYGALPSKFPVFPKLLEKAGYAIGSTGKTWGPGFLKAGGWEDSPTGQAYNQIKLKPRPEGMNNIDYAANFDAFLEDRPQDQPFCFWYGPFEPHRVYEKGAGLNSGKKLEDAKLPPSYPDTPEIRSDVLDYYHEIEHLDAHLMRMINTLEEKGELENTLIIATSDNGMPFPRCKANLYDMGTREPFVVFWPKKIPGGRVVNDMVSLVDVAPTFLEAAGLPIPKQMAGRSLMPILQSDEEDRIDPQRDFNITYFERHTLCRPKDVGYPMRSLRTHRYRYIRNYEPDRWPAGVPDNESAKRGNYGDIDGSPSKSYMLEHKEDPAIKNFFLLAFEKRPPEELYDLENDPGEIHNLAENPDYQEIKKSLKARMEAYLKQTEDPRMQEQSPWDHYVYYTQKERQQFNQRQKDQ